MSETLQSLMNLILLTFVVSSMLAMGFSLPTAPAERQAALVVPAERLDHEVGAIVI